MRGLLVGGGVVTAAIAVGLFFYPPPVDAGDYAKNDKPEKAAYKQDKQEKSGEATPTSAAAAEAPRVERDLATILSQSPKFERLWQAIQAAGLESKLREGKAMTIYAPTNDAFAQIPEEQFQALLRPENREQLKGVLAYHVVEGMQSCAAACSGSELQTVQGGSLKVKNQDGRTIVNGGATVLLADVPATNGLIHVVDRVLMPEASEPQQQG